MLSDVPFWRLVWKEYRTHRPLWLAILIVTPVLQLAVVGFTQLQIISSGRSSMNEMLLNQSNGLVSIAYVSVVSYLIGCVGTMFAIDHETGVFSFVRVLPTTQPRVFWSKVGFAVVSWAALALLIGLITTVAFVSKVPENANWYWTYGALFLVEVFAWSLFSSLWVRQPLWAVVVALAGQALAYSLAFAVLNQFSRGFGWTPMFEDRLLLGYRLVTAVALLAGSVVCGRLWFDERLRFPRWRLWPEKVLIDSYDPPIVPLEPRVRVRRPAATIADDPPDMAERRASRSRLLWQSWRDARFLALGLIVTLPIWFASIVMLGQMTNYHWMVAVAWLLSCFLCGILSFGLDQQGERFRYFAERGCVPRDVWLCRQAVWLSTVVVMTPSIVSIASVAIPEFRSSPDQRATMSTVVVLGALLCYGVGQLTAMLIRSMVVAGAVGLALLFGGLMWSILMTSWQTPTWWTVGGVPAIALFVTWLKSNDWIEERRDRVARWRTRLGVGVPAAMLLIAIAAYRVVQIPAVTLPTEWDAPNLAASQLSETDRETLDLYRRALREMEAKGREHNVVVQRRMEQLRQEHPDWDEQQLIRTAYAENQPAWLERMAEVGSLLKQAHSRPAVPLAILQDELPMPVSGDLNVASPMWFHSVVHFQSQSSVAKGELDDAWREIEVGMEVVDRFMSRASYRYDLRFISGGESYPSITEWGRHPQQTRERIVAAIGTLEARESTALTFGLMAIHAELLRSRLVLHLDPRWRDVPIDAIERQYSMAPNSVPAWWWTAWRMMFWERWRSERVLRWDAALAVDSVRNIVTRVERGEVPQRLEHSVSSIKNSQPVLTNLGRTWYETRRPLDSPEMKLVQATVLPPFAYYGLAQGAEIQVFAHVEALRATRLQLALADWQREHGRYPETLDELVPTYFDKLPLDPIRAKPFGYLPNGLPEDVARDSETVLPDGRRQVTVLVPKNVPFLWTSHPHKGFSARQLPDGEWEFVAEGRVVAMKLALNECRIWQLPSMPAAER